MDPTLNKNIQFSDNSESDEDCANMQSAQDLSEWERYEDSQDINICEELKPAKRHKKQKMLTTGNQT